MSETTKKAKAPAKPRKTAANKATVTEISAPAAPSQEHVAPSHEAVAKLAHQYFIDRGHHHGHHVEDWFRAEQELRSKAS